MSSAQAFIDEAAKIYRVLSNSTRLNILYYLRHYGGETDVKTIVNDLHFAQPIVSKQLGILYRYQLVGRHKKGAHVYHALDNPYVIEMIDDMLKHAEHEIKGEPHPRNLYKQRVNRKQPSKGYSLFTLFLLLIIFRSCG